MSQGPPPAAPPNPPPIPPELIAIVGQQALWERQSFASYRTFLARNGALWDEVAARQALHTIVLRFDADGKQDDEAVEQLGDLLGRPDHTITTGKYAREVSVDGDFSFDSYEVPGLPRQMVGWLLNRAGMERGTSQLERLSLGPGCAAPHVNRLGFYLQAHPQLQSLGFDMLYSFFIDHVGSSLTALPTHPALRHLQLFSLGRNNAEQWRWATQVIRDNPQLEAVALHFHADEILAGDEAAVREDWGFLNGVEGLTAFRLVGYLFADVEEVEALGRVLQGKRLHHLTLAHLEWKVTPYPREHEADRDEGPLKALILMLRESDLPATMTSLHLAGPWPVLAGFDGKLTPYVDGTGDAEDDAEEEEAGDADEGASWAEDDVEAPRWPLVGELLIDLSTKGTRPLYPMRAWAFLRKFPCVQHLGIARTGFDRTWTSPIGNGPAMPVLEEALSPVVLTQVAMHLPDVRALSVGWPWKLEDRRSWLEAFGEGAEDARFPKLTTLYGRISPPLDVVAAAQTGEQGLVQRMVNGLRRRGSPIELCAIRANDALPWHCPPNALPVECSQLLCRTHKGRIGILQGRSMYAAYPWKPFGWTEKFELEDG